MAGGIIDGNGVLADPAADPAGGGGTSSSSSSSRLERLRAKHKKLLSSSNAKIAQSRRQLTYYTPEFEGSGRLFFSTFVNLAMFYKKIIIIYLLTSPDVNEITVPMNVTVCFLKYIISAFSSNLQANVVSEVLSGDDLKKKKGSEKEQC